MPLAQKPSILPSSIALRGVDAERYAGRIGRHRRRRDLHVVALRIDAVFLQQLDQADVDQRRRADPLALHGVDVAALDLEVRAHDQEPVGVLRQRAEELDALPFRKRRRRRMRRAADEIGLAVAQRLVAFADRIDQLQLRIEALFLEEAHLHRGDGGEIRVGDEIGNDDFHETLLLPFIRQRHDLVAVRELAAQHRVLQLHVERAGI